MTMSIHLGTSHCSQHNHLARPHDAYINMIKPIGLNCMPRTHLSYVCNNLHLLDHAAVPREY